jgi:RNA polymerase sigma-70 factor (ECF subfamily)
MSVVIDDGQLVSRARSGDRQAASALFERYWPDAFRTAYAIVGRRDAAEDAAQEGFVRAFGALDRFDTGRPFGAWLARIVVNCSIDRTRADRRLAPLNDDPGATWVTEVRHDELLAAVAALAPDRRQVVVLRYWAGLTQAEIATLLGVPLGTANSRLARAVDELRETLVEVER